MTSVADAFALFQRGDLAGAEAVLGAILERAPNDTSALGLMAGVLHTKGDLGGAAAMFERAHLLSPNDAEIAFNRAAVLSALGRHQECAEVAAAFLKLRPGDADALLMRGAALAALGEHDAALAALDQVKAERADVQVRRAVSLLRLKRADEALAAATRARDRDPRLVDAHYQRGLALGTLERWAEAVEAFDAALALAPNAFAIRASRAPALANVGRFDEALREIDLALARTPEDREYLARRAYVFSAAGRAAEALAAYDRVLAIAPDDGASIYAKCDLLLGGGDFERGLPLYEVRHGLHPAIAPASSAPVWLGETPLVGKSILVQGEQGFGDLFQFCRFVPELAARGATVILQERPQTLGVLRSLDGVAQLVSSKEVAPAADVRIPLASLMLALGVCVETIPAPVPYLYAEAERVARWRAALGVARGKRVGVVWAGVTRHAMQAWRSLDEAALTALLGAEVEFVSLQMEASEIAAAHDVRQFGKAIADFSELAALIETLDVVVGIDTGVAHLAGALGKPVLLMLPHRADWRWLRERSDTPWYPNMRLFRQARFGDWSGVIGGVHAALQE